MALPLSYVIERAMLNTNGRWHIAGRDPDQFRIGDVTLTLKKHAITVSHNGMERDYSAGDIQMEFSRMVLHLSVIKRKIPPITELDVVANLSQFEHGFTLVQAIDALGVAKRHVLFFLNKLINQNLIMEYPVVSGPKRWITTVDPVDDVPDLSAIDTVERLEWMMTSM